MTNRASSWLRPFTLTAALLAAGLGAATPAAQASPAPVARAAAVKAGCTVVPLDPEVKKSYSVVATNSTSCHGPVSNVRLTVKLHQFKLGWTVAEQKSVNWGTVKVSRYGYAQAWTHSIPEKICYKFITEARVTWKDSKGNPGEAALFSRTVQLRSDGHRC